jgi:pimeloyl-ACP methyl ester carboxylesterase
MPKALVNGINIYYQVHGSGEPLVLIQGFGGDHTGWFFQTRAFKKHFQVVIFDNRGIGRTDPSPAPYTIRTMADDTVGLMDFLGIDKAHILGMSLGGMVAQEIALDYPDRVRRLLLICTTPGQEEVSRVSPKLLEAFGVKDGTTQRDLGSVDFLQTATTVTALAFNKRLYRMILVPLTKLYVKRVGIAGYLGQAEAVAGHSTRDRLHLIRVPTLVMTGTEDRIVSPSSSDEIARIIPHARLVKVEGGSHAFFIEMRGRFNREVLDFLRAG